MSELNEFQILVFVVAYGIPHHDAGMGSHGIPCRERMPLNFPHTFYVNMRCVFVCCHTKKGSLCQQTERRHDSPHIMKRLNSEDAFFLPVVVFHVTYHCIFNFNWL